MKIPPQLIKWFQGSGSGRVSGSELPAGNLRRPIYPQPMPIVRMPEKLGKSRPARTAEISSLSTPATRTDVEALMQKALSAPDAESLQHFLDFAGRFRRLAPFNLKMVYVQRPGAFAVAKRDEWEGEGRRIRGDAIPIIVLRPFGPIDYVYDEADVFPRPPREQADLARHASGVGGRFEERWLTHLETKCRGKGRKAQGERTAPVFRVEIERVVYGGRLMGTASSVRPWFDGELDDLRHRHAETEPTSANEETRFRIRLNKDLTEPQQFRVLAHELGHIFCGHLGGFPRERDHRASENGWPSRRGLSLAVREIEAEMVAWLVCMRLGMATGSPLYLKPHLQIAEGKNQLSQVSLDTIIAAVARIEKCLD